MKKLFGLLAAAALAVSAGSVMAEGDTHQKGATHKQATGRHEMTGRIVGIDKSEGSLKVETAQGQIDLHFPPASLQGYKEGDQVKVELSLRPAAAPQPQKQPAQPQKQPAPPTQQPPAGTQGGGM